MSKITKLSQLDPGIVELIQSDNDQDLILANNIMKALNIKLSGFILKDLNPTILISNPYTPTGSSPITAGKYVYEFKNNFVGLERYENWAYKPIHFKNIIDQYLHEREAVKKGI